MLTHYFARHLQASLYSLGKLTRAPWSSLVTCFIIGIALALPALFFVALKNAEALAGNIGQTMQITLYLKNNIQDTAVKNLADRLQTNPSIQTIRAISPAQGLEELEKQAGVNHLSTLLQENPLPWALIVVPTPATQTPTEIDSLQQQLKNLPEVESVQLDRMWINRLTSLMALAHRITFALAIFLGFAVLFIVNNIIRSATQQHQHEIEVIQLIGGTPAFIRRPFLYAGMAYGFFGGLLAWMLVNILLLLLKNPAQQLAALYGNPFTPLGMGAVNLSILLISGIALGLIGSWVAVARHLQQYKVQ